MAKKPLHELLAGLSEDERQEFAREIVASVLEGIKSGLARANGEIRRIVQNIKAATAELRAGKSQE